jgi:D-3-phosphoglycerate dehydrogenase
MTDTAKARILVTHTPAMRTNYYPAAALDDLRRLGDVILYDGNDPLSPEHVVSMAQGCRLIIADRNTPLPALVFETARSVIAALRVAVDIRNIDVAAASAAGILVCQASRTWVPAVAELAIGLMIDAARGISRANIAYKAGRAPDIRMGRQLRGATAGIIGYGPLGRSVADLALAFGMTVLVHDPYVQIDRAELTETGFNELLARADFVLPLAVATTETENLINRRALSLMKPGAYLINLSRGNLIDEDAILAALSDGHLAGAALDVGRAPDQMPSPGLAARPDVSATPHIGGLTQAAIEGQAFDTVRQAADILAGRVPDGAVNLPAAFRLQAG